MLDGADGPLYAGLGLGLGRDLGGTEPVADPIVEIEGPRNKDAGTATGPGPAFLVELLAAGDSIGSGRAAIGGSEKGMSSVNDDI